MRRIATCAAALLMVVAFGAAYAKGAPGRPAQAGPKAKPAAANTGVAKSATAKAPKAKAPKTKGPKVATGGSSAAATTSAAAGSGKANAPGQMKKNPQAADGTLVTPGANVPKNPKLQARLQAMLPEGMTLEEAAAGFKNQGQFIAAVHASDRLDVAFQDLKVKMVDEGASLGQAIQTLKPEVDAEVEASAAQARADQDLK